MEYEIFINGGFTNIPKQYKGEIVMGPTQKSLILNSLGVKSKPSNKINDGFIYHIKLLDGDKEFKSVFDEHNLPEPVRNFVDGIIRDKRN